MLLKLSSLSRTKNLAPCLPPGPWKLPIVGSIHHLGGSLPHQRFKCLAEKYGPLMHLQLGELSVMVVSSPETAKKTNSQDLLSGAFKPHASPIFFDMPGRSAFGMKCKDQELFIELVKEASAAAAGFHISDIFPSSTLLPKLTGFKAKLKDIRGRYGEITGNIIKEYQTKKVVTYEDEDLVDVLLRYEGEDLVDVLLRYQDDVEFHYLLLICVNNTKSIPITPRFALNQPLHVLFYYQ
ncbi:cytochrome P450 71D11 [Tanacetum coccineum]|uniref:Cytochrome P450 71D11 n=1 Tax=Tanacetum coccineum TaxID=301880 RepID=A0ABQ5AVI3_9ASTR